MVTSICCRPPDKQHTNSPVHSCGREGKEKERYLGNVRAERSFAVSLLEAHAQCAVRKYKAKIGCSLKERLAASGGSKRRWPEMQLGQIASEWALFQC